MKKLELFNIILISIIIIGSIIFFIILGFEELIAMIKYGHDDFLGLGLPQIITAIISIIYLILAIKILKKNKINNLIKKAYWINIIGFILFVIGSLISLISTIKCRIINSGECMLGFKIFIYLLTFIWTFMLLVSFIIFLIGYFKTK